MKYVSALWLISLLVIPFVSLGQADTLVEAKECRIRGGLPNFFKKLTSGKSVKIAYFGGSITEAKGGWREQSLAWIQGQYPKAKVSQISAAIGGTGSDLGVFRLREQVLAHDPDLVFVEFAVNDGSKTADFIGRTMEGIVRQIWQANSQTDICFVYTLTATMAPILEKGRFPVSASAMERVADHYDIPSVHTGLDVVRLGKVGDLIYKGKPDEFPGKLVFSADNVHPYAQTGHRLYTEALARSLKQIAETDKKRSKRLPQPLFPDNWEKAQMISVRRASHSSGWQEVRPETDSVAKLLANRFPFLLKATKPGEKLHVRFKGTHFGLYDVMGPGCGQYKITVDGREATLYPRFDEYCTYYRSHYFVLPALPNGVHTIELEVAADPLDKAAILSKRGNVITNPSRYAANDCYAGQLLIIGELIDP